MLTAAKENILFLIRFFKKPNEKQLSINFLRKFGVLFTLVPVVGVFLVLIVSPLEQLYVKLFNADNLRTTHFENITARDFFIWGVLIAPVTEEFLFRFPLKWNRNYLFRLLSQLIEFRIQPYWKKHLIVPIIVSSLIFGFVHIGNFASEIPFFVLGMIILTLSQTILGFILSFLRLKLGFEWAVSFHMLWNGLIFLFVLILSDSLQPVKLQTTAYEFQVEGMVFKEARDTSSSIYYTKDSLITEAAGTNVSIRDFYSAHFPDEKEPQLELIQRMNFSFRSNTDGIERDSLVRIMNKQLQEMEK